MISFLIYLLVLVVIFGVGWWIIGMIPLPPPINQIVQVVFVVIMAICLVMLLLSLIGVGTGLPALR